MLVYRRPVVVIADNLFGSQVPIEFSEYFEARDSFFRKMDKVPRNKRDSFFYENYHSDGTIAWFNLKGRKYFTILYIGAIEERYYGKQHVFINY